MNSPMRNLQIAALSAALLLGAGTIWAVPCPLNNQTPYVQWATGVYYYGSCSGTGYGATGALVSDSANGYGGDPNKHIMVQAGLSQGDEAITYALSSNGFQTNCYASDTTADGNFVTTLWTFAQCSSSASALPAGYLLEVDF